MNTMAKEDDTLPAELEEPCSECHNALAGVEKLLKPLLATSKAQNEEKLGALDSASEVLLLSYCVNSLYWVYLAVKGVDPKTHLIKQELERIQKVMKRAQSVSQKEGASEVRINTQAAKRFIRNALWEQGEEDDGQKKKRRLDHT